ncbi:sodium P-type ATPase [Aspergillus affinis]|uniref:sodium P-type ATPase n=1 Tax=Aspergillus affinis TaxID=1070780 RepID=UPI0022FE9937|nr:sodium P-type ATPase [Aspergillus affinis]KAI9036327.1 sodium P-type ATPase [Aspergillus affinis]
MTTLLSYDLASFSSMSALCDHIKRLESRWGRLYHFTNSTSLVETVNFETDEALLTGESLPVQKECDSTFKEDTGPGDRLNIAYSSSTVTRGRGRGVVVSTGMSTEIGSIALALRGSDSKRRPVKRDPNGETKKRQYFQAWTLTGTDAVGRFLGINIGTLLQRKLSKLACLPFGVTVIFAIVCMAANLFSSNTEVIMYAVATGISMIPACLVVVLTITMAVGTKRMVQRNVIVRKLDTLEALGAVTDICSEKTGTYSIGTSNETFNPTIGDVTFTPVSPLQFDDEKEGPAAENAEGLVSGKRQLEDFLDVASMANLSHVYMSEEGEWNARALVPMTDDHREKIFQNMEELAKLGLRVLALAHRPYTGQAQLLEGSDLEREDVENDLCFLGLIELYDPPRPETANSIQACYRAGIVVHMVTGDHPGTAKAIAQQVGILPADFNAVAADVADAMVMTASQFDKLTDEEVDSLPTLPLVIAHCTPQTKYRYGTGRFRLAKDASDIILTDDNFASILNAVEESRRIFDNIQKFVLHLLSENIAQACTLLIGLAFKDADNQSVFPLSPVKILWIIMITSGIFTWEVIIDILVYGIWTAALCLAAFSVRMWGFGDGKLARGCNKEWSEKIKDRELVFRARATTFVCLTWFALFLAWEMVNMRRSFFRMQPKSKKYFTQWMYDVWRNKFLSWSIMARWITMFPVLYIPVLNDVVFKHKPITWEWGIVAVEAVLFFIGVEAWKWAKRVFFRRRARKYPKSSPLEDIPERL